MTVSTELATELRKALQREVYIYANSADPANDFIPVPRYLVETAAEMLEISQNQVHTLHQLTLALSAALNDFVTVAPFNHPSLANACRILAAVEAMKVIT